MPSDNSTRQPIPAATALQIFYMGSILARSFAHWWRRTGEDGGWQRGFGSAAIGMMRGWRSIDRPTILAPRIR